jgi:hypothetical protein
LASVVTTFQWVNQGDWNSVSVDHNLQLRRGILPLIKIEPVVLELAGARVYSEAPKAMPAFPFVRYGNSDGTPTEWSCTEGSVNSGTIHVFSRADGTDECARLRRAVCRAIDGKTVQLEADPDTDISATALNIQVSFLPAIFRDTDDTAAWHGVINWTTEVAEDY